MCTRRRVCAGVRTPPGGSRPWFVAHIVLGLPRLVRHARQDAKLLGRFAPAHAKNAPLFECFPYVCPEPVLVK
jgi:hypothetical protein